MPMRKDRRGRAPPSPGQFERCSLPFSIGRHRGSLYRTAVLHDLPDWNQGLWNGTSDRRFPVTGYFVEYSTGGEVTPDKFVRGDADSGGGLAISDAVLTLRYLFVGQADLPCPDAADADNSGMLNVSDAIWILSYLFLGTDSPMRPRVPAKWTRCKRARLSGVHRLPCALAVDSLLCCAPCLDDHPVVRRARFAWTSP